MSRAWLRFILGLLLAIGAAHAEPQLALRADLWCPYNCEPGAAEPGFLIELVQAALPAARIDYAIGRWTQLRRQRSAPPAPVLVLLGVTDSAVTRRDLLVVRPAFGQAQTCAYRHIGHTNWWLNKPADLRGQRLSLTLGYSYHPEVDALVAEPAMRRKITQIHGERASLSHARMLALRRVDVALEERAVMQWGLRQLDAAARAQVVEAGCLPPQASDAMHFGLPVSDPRSPAVAAALQQGMQRLQASGELARLRARYGLTP